MSADLASPFPAYASPCSIQSCALTGDDCNAGRSSSRALSNCRLPRAEVIDATELLCGCPKIPDVTASRKIPAQIFAEWTLEVRIGWVSLFSACMEDEMIRMHLVYRGRSS